MIGRLRRVGHIHAPKVGNLGDPARLRHDDRPTPGPATVRANDCKAGHEKNCAVEIDNGCCLVGEDVHVHGFSDAKCDHGRAEQSGKLS